MAVHLLRNIIDDISKDLKQTFDDRTVEKTQIGYWVLLIANRLRSQHIKKMDSGMFKTTFVDVPIQIVTTSDEKNEIPNRKHIRLPQQIYDFDKDKGIIYIAYYRSKDDPQCDPRFTQVVFNRTTPEAAHRLYKNPYERPSIGSPYFYVIGDFVYFLGLECSNVKNIEICLYTTLDPITTIDIDSKFEFPEELLNVLKRQVLDLGRFALMIPEERINNGIDGRNTAQVPSEKLISVNDPVNNPQNE